jgi:hypothetical protein
MSPRALLLFLLLIMEIGMLLMAAFYLRRRRMGWLDYLAWGIVAVALPVLGPFLVIAFHPGEARFSRTADCSHGGCAPRLRVDDRSVGSR